jgi:hypothetical protein
MRGGKFSGGTDGMIVRGSEVHENFRSGLCWDGYYRNAQVYGNVIRDNRTGHLLGAQPRWSDDPRQHTLTGNGLGDGRGTGSTTCSSLVSCSDGSVGRIEIFDELSYGGTKIHDNTLTGNGLGDCRRTGSTTCTSSSPPRTGA